MYLASVFTGLHRRAESANQKCCSIKGPPALFRRGHRFLVVVTGWPLSPSPGTSRTRPTTRGIACLSSSDAGQVVDPRHNAQSARLSGAAIWPKPSRVIRADYLTAHLHAARTILERRANWAHRLIATTDYD